MAQTYEMCTLRTYQKRTRRVDEPNGALRARGQGLQPPGDCIRDPGGRELVAEVEPGHEAAGNCNISLDDSGNARPTRTFKPQLTALSVETFPWTGHL